MPKREKSSKPDYSPTIQSAKKADAVLDEEICKDIAKAMDGKENVFSIDSTQSAE